VTITACELLHFAIPLAAPLHTSYGPVTARRGTVIVLRAGDNVGLGEAAPHPAAAGALGDIRAALADAAGWLVGAEATDLDRLLARTATLPRPAASAIDMALHDLVGHATGRPVHALLGGSRRDLVAASALLDAGEPGACAAQAIAAAAAGFGVVKLKLDRDLEAAVARVARVAEVAPMLHIRLDANGALTPAAALEVAGRLDRTRIAWLEQPTPPGDRSALACVRRDAGIPIAADEAVTGPDAATALAGAADVAVLKLVQVGGLRAARATAEAATAAGLAVCVTTAIDTGIGRAAALHLACALPVTPPACGVATRYLMAGDLVQQPIPDRARMAPPPGPGLGIRLDPDALARWRDPEAG